MQGVVELLDHCTNSILAALNAADEKLFEQLETSGATPLGAGRQIVQLQKAIFAIGMFSIFDAMLQHRLKCTDGFRRAAEFSETKASTISMNVFATSGTP